MPYSPNNTPNGLSRRYTSLHSLAQARIRLLKPEQLTRRSHSEPKPATTNPEDTAREPLSHTTSLDATYQRSNRPTKSLCFVHFLR